MYQTRKAIARVPHSSSLPSSVQEVAQQIFVYFRSHFSLSTIYAMEIYFRRDFIFQIVRFKFNILMKIIKIAAFILVEIVNLGHTIQPMVYVFNCKYASQFYLYIEEQRGRGGSGFRANGVYEFEFSLSYVINVCHGENGIPSTFKIIKQIQKCECAWTG